jgi:hypothetical protein
MVPPVTIRIKTLLRSDTSNDSQACAPHPKRARTAADRVGAALVRSVAG